MPNETYEPIYDLSINPYDFIKHKYKNGGGDMSEQSKSKATRFKKKIDKASLIIPKIREQFDLIHSFLFDLVRKPEEIEQNEKRLEKLIARMPKFTQDEHYGLLTEEYELVNKYLVCLSCKKDLEDSQMDNENKTNRIICNECGMSYYNQKNKKKKIYKSVNLSEDGNVCVQIDPVSSPIAQEEWTGAVTNSEYFIGETITRDNTQSPDLS